MNRRIKVKSLPPTVAKAISRAFRQAGVMGLYRDDAVTMLDVVREQLRDTQARNRKLHRQIDRIADIATKEKDEQR